jgi:putative ABC transport system ATP-binding protein
MSPHVEVSGLTVAFTRNDYTVKALDGFAMEVDPGRLALLIGPSGCGKTTLLSCLAGILEPTSGTVRVGDTEVTLLKGRALEQYRRRQVGVVFQAFNLVPSLNALENVMIPMHAAGIERAEARKRATELLSGVGLDDRLRHRPSHLSGGQMQRVAIARALALDAPLVIADEPTANLDHVQVETVLRLIRSLTNRGRTVIVSTHDPRLLPLADDVIDMAPQTAPSTAATDVVSLAAGEVLFSEGSVGDLIYRIESGEVVITQNGQQVRILGPCDVFGEMGPVFHLPRTASAVAHTDAELTGYTVDEFRRQYGADELRRLVGRYIAS